MFLMKKIVLITYMIAALCACGPTKSVSRDNGDEDFNLGYMTVSKNAMSDTGNSLKISESDSDQYNSMVEYLTAHIAEV